jgi:hypothetical protein
VDQAGLVQPGQVGGDVGLGAAEFGGEIDDALFPGLQGEQDGRVGLARTRNSVAACCAAAASGPRLIGMRSR